MSKTKQVKKIESYILQYPTVSNAEIAKKFKIDRTKVWRIRRALNTPKFNKNEGTPKRTSSSTQGFDGLIETTIDEKTGDKKIQIAHAGGPIRGTRNKINYSVMGIGDDYDEDLVDNWTPNMQLSPVNSNTLMICFKDESYNRYIFLGIRGWPVWLSAGWWCKSMQKHGPSGASRCSG